MLKVLYLYPNAIYLMLNPMSYALLANPQLLLLLILLLYSEVYPNRNPISKNLELPLLQIFYLIKI